MLEAAYKVWRIAERTADPRSLNYPLAERKRMEEEMRGAYRGPALPFVFGYGRSGKIEGKQANGIMLTAWLRSIGTNAAGSSEATDAHARERRIGASEGPAQT